MPCVVKLFIYVTVQDELLTLTLEATYDPDAVSEAKYSEEQVPEKTGAAVVEHCANDPLTTKTLASRLSKIIIKIL